LAVLLKPRLVLLLFEEFIASSLFPIAVLHELIMDIR
jgi:hypothetical protein